MLIVFLFCNVIRHVWCKLLYGGRYQSAWIERIHNSVDIHLYGKRSSVSLGRNLEIAKDGELWCFDDGKLTIGDGCYFNNRFMVSCHCGVKIGEDCLFGPDVKIFDNNHRFSTAGGVKTDLSCAPVTIGKHCWIASNVVILKGTTIGDNCVIGAGCVITKDVPSNCIVKQSCDNIVFEEIKS